MDFYFESGWKHNKHSKQLCTKPIPRDKSCFIAMIMVGSKSVEKSPGVLEENVQKVILFRAYYNVLWSRSVGFFHGCIYPGTSIWRHAELYDSMEINMVMNMNMTIINTLKRVSCSWVNQEGTKCIVPTNPPQSEERNEQHFVIIHSDIFSHIYCQKKYHFLELKERAANRNSYVISNCKHVFSSSFW